MVRHDTLHAMAYAENLTRIHMLERFRRKYPGLFVHAVLETRRADPSRDYYSPPSIADRCVAIEKLFWNATGCELVACFPYKGYEEPCVRGTDSMQWVRVDDSRHVLACQPACERGMTLDARFRDGDCFVSNAAKKLYAMYPERYNGAVAKHARLTLDPETDRLRVNPALCEAYGLKFDSNAEDCYLPSGQYVAELFVGSSVFRRKLIAANYKPPAEPPSPPPWPDHAASFDRSWEKIEIADEIFDAEKTAAVDPSTALEDDLKEDLDSKAATEEMIRWLASELAVEFGVHAAVRQIRVHLTRKLSAALATRVASDPALKYALLHGTLKSVAPRAAISFSARSLTGQASLVAVKSAFSMASLALSIFGLTSLLIDVFDPYEYGKALDRERVDRIDKTLDLRYFGTDQFRNVRLTPEDVWELLADEKDAEVELRHYKKCFDEYTKALRDYRPPVLKKLELVDVSAAASAAAENELAKEYSLWKFPLWIAVAVACSAAFTIFDDFRHVDYFAMFLCALFLIWKNHVQG